mgnify:CR=1 FL=1
MSYEIKTTEGIGTDKVPVLIYVASSMGKTSLLGGLKGKTLIISAEGGLLVLRDKKIDVVEVSTMEEFGEVFLALRDGELKYDNVAIDSLSEIGRFDQSQAHWLCSSRDQRCPFCPTYARYYPASLGSSAARQRYPFSIRQSHAVMPM